MYRRSVLAGLAAGSASLAGCSSLPSPDSSPEGNASGNGGGTRPANGAAVAGQVADADLPIPDSELTRGATKDGIPAITDPEFAPDWSDVDVSTSPRLNPDDQVIGVARDGEARAYPIRILNFHEIVNDDFGGPLLVTFCPLCGSGITAVRRVDGEPTTFGVSGLLWQSDLVMYDQATESLWSQIAATAIQGPQTGAELDLVPSSFTTWSAWQESHPDTEVLLPPPISDTIVPTFERPYNGNSYAGYEDSETIGIGQNDFDDDRLHPKTRVIGVAHGDEAVAYPLSAVQDDGIINDTVGGLPVGVAAGSGGTLVAYERRIDGETFTLELTDDGQLRGAGTTWDLLSGEGYSGTHDGRQLTPAQDRSPMFWFAWAEFHPDTAVYEP